MLNFAAIDFETATGKRDSACSVAVVEVRGGEIVDSYYTLIRPPRNYYQPFNIHIHGIHPEDTADVAPFAGIWEELYSHLAGRVVVAHNATFDMGVLRACLQSANLQLPTLEYCDTVGMARKLWPFLENHKLDTVGRHLAIKFKHHNALDDARTCAAIPIAAAAGLPGGEELDFASMARAIGVPLKIFGTNAARRCYK